MLGNFRKTFKPTKAEIQAQRDKAFKAVAQSIQEKACWLCVHFFFDKSIPGFVDYRGECKLGNKIDALRSAEEECVSWEPDKGQYLVAEVLEREVDNNEKDHTQH